MANQIILHIDMDSYFASVEQQANPILRGKPIGVTGGDRLTRTILVAASKEAKKYGVKTGMRIKEAKIICPSLIIVCGDSYKYLETSKKIFAILNSYSPLMEIFSIDEVFLDVTNTHHLFTDPVNIAKEIKKRIKNEVGSSLTCSIGIAHNKLLAKLASGLKKPNGLVVIDENKVNEVLDDIDLTDICGIGQRIKTRLNLLGVYNFGQLRQIPASILLSHFGNFWSIHLKNLANGFDDSPILPYYERPEVKSIGHRQTLEKNIDDPNEIKKLIFKISQILGKNLRDKNLAAKTIFLYLRMPDLSGTGKQKSLKDFTDNDLIIYKAAIAVLEDLKWHSPTRMIGLSIANLIPKSFLTGSLFDQKLKKEQVIKAADKINDRYGLFTIQPATTLTFIPINRHLSSFASNLRFKSSFAPHTESTSHTREHFTHPV